MDMPLSGARDLLTGSVPSDALGTSLPGTLVTFTRHVFSIDPAAPHTRACDLMPILVAAAIRADPAELATMTDKGFVELIVRVALSPGRAQASAL